VAERLLVRELIMLRDFDGCDWHEVAQRRGAPSDSGGDCPPAPPGLHRAGASAAPVRRRRVRIDGCRAVR
jgi:hypothetical protein